MVKVSYRGSRVSFSGQRFHIGGAGVSFSGQGFI